MQLMLMPSKHGYHATKFVRRDHAAAYEVFMTRSAVYFVRASNVDVAVSHCQSRKWLLVCTNFHC